MFRANRFWLLAACFISFERVSAEPTLTKISNCGPGDSSKEISSVQPSDPDQGLKVLIAHCGRILHRCWNSDLYPDLEDSKATFQFDDSGKPQDIRVIEFKSEASQIQAQKIIAENLILDPQYCKIIPARTICVEFKKCPWAITSIK